MNRCSGIWLACWRRILPSTRFSGLLKSSLFIVSGRRVRGVVELGGPAAELGDRAVAVAQLRARLVDLVFPDRDVIADLPVDLLVEGRANAVDLRVAFRIAPGNVEVLHHGFLVDGGIG